MSLLPMTLADKLLLAIGTAREMLSTLGMPSVRIECEGWKLSVEALNIIATAQPAQNPNFALKSEHGKCSLRLEPA
jgi:hypothetical protein